MMKDFERFIEEETVQERTPNPSQGKSLKNKSRKRLDYVKYREVSKENADLILEDAYESIREIINAFLISEGYKSYNHEASIVYAFEELDISYEKVNKLNKFRELRNDSKYRGEDITKKEAQDTLELAEDLVPRLSNKFKGKHQ